MIICCSMSVLCWAGSMFSTKLPVTDRFRYIFVQICLFPTNRIYPVHFHFWHSHFCFRLSKKMWKWKWVRCFSNRSCLFSALIPTTHGRSRYHTKLKRKQGYPSPPDGRFTHPISLAADLTKSATWRKDDLLPSNTWRLLSFEICHKN
jgi:hypothetical protein